MKKVNIETEKELSSITKKKHELIDNVIKEFTEDEVLIDSFNTWAYSEDTTRIAISAVSRSAAMPMMGWSKIMLLILSNKRLYLVGATEYMDFVKKEVIELGEESDLESLEVFKKGEDEVIIIKIKDHKPVQYKTNKGKLTKFYKEIKPLVEHIRITYSKDKDIPMATGKKALIAENYGIAIIMLIMFLIIIIGLIN